MSGEDDDWGAAAADGGEIDNFTGNEIELPLRSEKGYKAVKSNHVSK